MTTGGGAAGRGQPQPSGAEWGGLGGVPVSAQTRRGHPCPAKDENGPEFPPGRFAFPGRDAAAPAS
ncbi:hypothetical protein MACH21_21830 [Roseicyclus marinus]|uniref:Uncharacterized protein n=1 Tax=Roseicyclus marinus TaxID=2161673 RepID=A0AA48HTW7_9RHOB|nr:hypothetical protein MACH21_21830 [Roseicyclus marinus]